MRLARVLAAAMVICSGLLLTACLDSSGPPTVEPIVAPTPTAMAPGLVVFAAASLRDAFTVMADSVPISGPVKANFNFAGSQTLATQLSQGARADVFASADAINLNKAVDAGSVATGTQKLMATNHLVVIVPPGDNQKVNALADLVKPGVKIVMADSTVPAGNYALQSLGKLSADKAYGASFKREVLANVVSKETDVRQVLSKVQLGEADAGFVYLSDTIAAGKPLPGRMKAPTKLPLGIIEIPKEYNVIAQYLVAPVKDAPHPDAAKTFIDYVLSAAGQKTLQDYGFGPATGGQ